MGWIGLKLRVLFDKFTNKMQGFGATEAPLFLTVLKQYKGGKSPDLIVAGQLHIFIFIHLNLGDTQLITKLGGNFFQYRGNHSAGRAPFRPQIHQNGSLFRGFDNAFLKVVQVGNKNRVGLVYAGHGRYFFAG